MTGPTTRSRAREPSADPSTRPTKRLATRVLSGSRKAQPGKEARNGIIFISSDEEDIEQVPGPSKQRKARKGAGSSQEQSDLENEFKRLKEENERVVAELKEELDSKSKELEKMKGIPSNTTSNDELIESVRNILTCQICFETLKKPYALSACGHEFCGTCIKEWLTRPQQEGPPELVCPNCRKPITTRPVRTFLLQNVIDLVKDPTERTPPKSRATPTDDVAFWKDMFDQNGKLRPRGGAAPIVGPANQYAPHANFIVGPAPAPHAPGPLGVGPGSWVLPTHTVLPPYFGNMPGLTVEQLALIRRGASLPLIQELNLRYDSNSGITGNIGEYHFHFGWQFNPRWKQAPVQDVDGVIQVDMIDYPERFRFANGCIYELVWRPA